MNQADSTNIEAKMYDIENVQFMWAKALIIEQLTENMGHNFQ